MENHLLSHNSTNLFYFAEERHMKYFMGVGSPLTDQLSGSPYTAQEIGEYAYYPGSQHNDKVVGQYAYCPGSKHTARVSKRAVTHMRKKIRKKIRKNIFFSKIHRHP